MNDEQSRSEAGQSHIELLGEFVLPESVWVPSCGDLRPSGETLRLLRSPTGEVCYAGEPEGDDKVISAFMISPVCNMAEAADRTDAVEIRAANPEERAKFGLEQSTDVGAGVKNTMGLFPEATCWNIGRGDMRHVMVRSLVDVAYQQMAVRSIAPRDGDREPGGVEFETDAERRKQNPADVELTHDVDLPDVIRVPAWGNVRPEVQTFRLHCSRTSDDTFYTADVDGDKDKAQAVAIEMVMDEGTELDGEKYELNRTDLLNIHTAYHADWRKYGLEGRRAMDDDVGSQRRGITPDMFLVIGDGEGATEKIAKTVAAIAHTQAAVHHVTMNMIRRDSERADRSDRERGKEGFGR